MHQPIDPSEIVRRRPRPSLHQEYRDLPIADARPSDWALRLAVAALAVGVAVLAYAIAVWGRA